MRLNKKGALIALTGAGGTSYAAYELSDTFSPLSYSLEVPVIPTLDFSEDVLPTVNFPNPANLKEETGAQPSESDSKTVITELPVPKKAPESKEEKQEKEQNTITVAEVAPPQVRNPAPKADAKVVETKVLKADKVTIPISASATPPPKKTKAPSKPKAKAKPKSKEDQRKEAQQKLVAKHKTLASSLGLTVVDDKKARNIDRYDGGKYSTGARVKSFIVGEDAEYMKTLWTNSIAIKHREIWNLAPDDDPIWDIQLKNAQERFWHHGEDTFFDRVFGDFTMNARWKNIPFLNKKNLARRCKENLARTPWGTWWSGAWNEYWSRLWDFCAKPEWHEKGIPTNIDYWYRNYTGPRRQVEFKRNKKP